MHLAAAPPEPLHLLQDLPAAAADQQEKEPEHQGGPSLRPGQTSPPQGMRQKHQLLVLFYFVLHNLAIQHSLEESKSVLCIFFILSLTTHGYQDVYQSSKDLQLPAPLGMDLRLLTPVAGPPAGAKFDMRSFIYKRTLYHVINQNHKIKIDTIFSFPLPHSCLQ